jgi:hypothetical protein
MKVRIHYGTNKNGDYTADAYCLDDSRYVMGVSPFGYEQAKDNAIHAITSMPPDEEVEI